MLTRLATQEQFKICFGMFFELIDATTGLFSHYEPKPIECKLTQP